MTTVIRGCDLVDGRGTEPRRGVDVVVEGDTVREIIEPGNGDYPSAEVVDAAGMLVIPGLINNHTHGTAYGPLFPSGHEPLPHRQVAANLDRHLLEGTTTLLCVDGFITAEAVARTDEAHPVNVKAASCNTPACLEAAIIADGGGLVEENKAFSARQAVAEGAIALGEIGAGHTLGGGGASYLYIPEEIARRIGVRVTAWQANQLKIAVLGRHITTSAFDRDAVEEALAAANLTGRLSVEDVREIVRIAARHKAPLIPFGTGSSLEGHINAPHGGISVDLARMNRVLEVNAEDLDCRVEPGITREELNTYLRDTGLFFPIDPGANASIGGMASTRASGTNAVRYGTMKDNVLALTVVLADGTILKTGGRARKSSAGYDLTRLFVGSEGTLGLATEITLRLVRRPEAVQMIMAAFHSTDDAGGAVSDIIAGGILPAAIEMMDHLSLQAVEKATHAGYPTEAGAALIVELDGPTSEVSALIGTVEDICRRNKAWEVRRAETADERALGKPIASDLREGKVTLPIIYLLERGGRAREIVEGVVRDRDVTRELWAELKQLLGESQSIVRARRQAEHYAEVALQHLSAFPPSPERDALLALPEYVLSRDR